MKTWLVVILAISNVILAAEGSAGSSGKDAAKVPKKKKTVKKQVKTHSCMGACFGACTGQGKKKTTIGDIVSDGIALAGEVTEANQDKNVNGKEAKDIANGSAALGKHLNDIAENFNELRKETKEVEVEVEEDDDENKGKVEAKDEKK